MVLESIGYVGPGRHEGDYVERCKHFTKLPERTWQWWTDWERYPVPLDIIEKMRLAEGLTMDEWYQRRVEVSAQAWEILLEWQKGLKDKSS